MPNSYWTVSKEFVGLGCVHIFTGLQVGEARGKIEIGTGTVRGCTENSDGEDSVPIVICLEKVNYSVLTQFFKGMSPEKLMTKVTQFVSKEEAMLKAYYGASKVDINYSWRP